jgi:hypothetical protein
MHKTGLGVSVYLKDYLEDAFACEQYLAGAAKLGFSEVFTSIHLPEDDFMEVSGAIKEFSKIVSKTR